MKCLKIDNGKGEFSVDGVNFLSLDKITKEDILILIDITLDPSSSIEMDVYDADAFTNPAHKMIYDHLYDKFTDLVANKDQFVSEVNEKYQDVYERYKTGDADSTDKVGE